MIRYLCSYLFSTVACLILLIILKLLFRVVIIIFLRYTVLHMWQTTLIFFSINCFLIIQIYFKWYLFPSSLLIPCMLVSCIRISVSFVLMIITIQILIRLLLLHNKWSLSRIYEELKRQQRNIRFQIINALFHMLHYICAW